MLNKKDVNVGKIVWIENLQVFGVILKLNAKSVRLAIKNEETTTADYEQLSLEGCSINNLNVLKPIQETVTAIDSGFSKTFKAGSFGYVKYEEDTEFTQENLNESKIVPFVTISKNTAMIKIAIFENPNISTATKILVLSPNVAQKYIAY